jgi:hypothetical protein
LLEVLLRMDEGGKNEAGQGNERKGKGGIYPYMRRNTR